MFSSLIKELDKFDSNITNLGSQFHILVATHVLYLRRIYLHYISYLFTLAILAWQSQYNHRNTSVNRKIY